MIFFFQISHNNEMVCSAASGAMAGFLGKTAITPLDRTKIYFTAAHPHRHFHIRAAMKFLKHTYHKNGILNLWRGNSVTMVRTVPYGAILFVSYEEYSKILRVKARNL